jgi:hypothetical protein
MSQIQVAAATGQPLMAPPIPAHFAYNFQQAANPQLMQTPHGYQASVSFLFLYPFLKIFGNIFC